ncbi:MAG TPA: hypothetical protein VK629_15440 [Steroidobacteraceae bacterium]|nr:hypothetical protein [Steroidobacteraceae bacterium]
MNAGLFDQMWADSHYLWYQGACAAKHANPVLQRGAMVPESDAMRILNADVAFSHRAGSSAFAAMFIAAIPGVIALKVFAEGCPESISAATFAEIEEVIPRWNNLRGRSVIGEPGARETNSRGRLAIGTMLL